MGYLLLYIWPCILAGALLGAFLSWLLSRHACTTETEKLRSETNTLRAEVEKRKGDYETLQADFDRRALEFANLNVDTNTLRGEVEQLRAQVAAFEGDATNYRGTAESLRLDLDTLQGQFESRDADAKRLQAENEQLRREMTALQESLERAGADTDRLRAEWEALRRENARLQQEVMRFEAASASAPVMSSAAPTPSPSGPSPSEATPPHPTIALIPVSGESETAQRAASLQLQIPARLNETTDDLEVIVGIGPVINRQLQEIGITTYRQIALLTPEQVERVGQALQVFRNRVTRERWVEQARQLHFQKYGERLGFWDETDMRNILQASTDPVAVTGDTSTAQRAASLGLQIPQRRGEETDDLEAISGIGPVIHQQLKEIGIVTFRQIALLDREDIEKVGEALEVFRDRIYRESWQDQARQLHQEKYGESL